MVNSLMSVVSKVKKLLFCIVCIHFSIYAEETRAKIKGQASLGCCEKKKSMFLD